VFSIECVLYRLVEKYTPNKSTTKNTSNKYTTIFSIECVLYRLVEKYTPNKSTNKFTTNKYTTSTMASHSVQEVHCKQVCNNTK